MLRSITINSALMVLVWAGTLDAQTILIDRQPGFAIEDENGVLAGESNRFNDFSGFYPADHFVLEQTATLEEFIAYGSTFTPSTFPTSPGSLEGITVQIFNSATAGIPDGNAFADVFNGGNFGSDGIVYLPAVELGFGFQFLQNNGGVATISIDFTTANGGKEITLPAGEYWITVAPRTPAWHPGDPSGRWKWQSSGVASDFDRVVMSRTTSGDVQVWEPISPNLGGSFAWRLTGEVATLPGDVNLDGDVNLLDVAPFVDLVSTGMFQQEADMNQDGFVNLLDVAPFVAALGG